MGGGERERERESFSTSNVTHKSYIVGGGERESFSTSNVTHKSYIVGGGEREREPGNESMLNSDLWPLYRNGRIGDICKCLSFSLTFLFQFFLQICHICFIIHICVYIMSLVQVSLTTCIHNILSMLYTCRLLV